MPSPTSQAVRRQFLDFFRARGHEEVPSASLVPGNDPTLLFTNAGMNQFKDVFTGQTIRAKPRATSAQKCVRAGGKHNDLENVGRTARHHTFFEMLGNFSFGDYFKTDAISFAFDLLTKEYKIPESRLVYTVHHTDDEARALWKKVAGVDDDKIIGLGDKDNFWAMGDTGPCGPCSEIHFHQGDDIPCAEATAGRPCLGPACDCDRWLEIWNLVFMQFEQRPGGERRPLPRPSVDTGMGLERLCAVLQNKRSNYETDLLLPLIDRILGLPGEPVAFEPWDYEGSSVSLRAIADHARAAAFLIADGVFPEKSGREYVLRRIMRRAIYHGASKLHIKEPFLHTIAADVVEMMGGVYPELRERASVIAKVTNEEETRFRETLERGMGIFAEEIFVKGKEHVPGELAFKLYDTYGFPLDLTRVIAEQHGLKLDEAGFEVAMNRQRGRSEFHGSGEAVVESIYKDISQKVGPTTFLGYEATSATSRITALVGRGHPVQIAGRADGPIAVTVEATPFYGEQGGQVGDSGSLRADGAVMRVQDVKRPVPTLYVHTGEIAEGELHVGDTVELTVDVARRDAVRRNHSATHLLHWALRHVLGDHVSQKGSLVAPDRLRFDFSHFAPLSVMERQQVEDLVNARVRANVGADTQVLAIADAKKAGAIAFFGEKYGDTVRVVTMAESKEFCGGTHVIRTGDIAFFKITEETGVAQGVRRIEAVTGEGALMYVRRMEAELDTAGERLRTSPFGVADKVEKLQAELRERDREVEKWKRTAALSGVQATVSAGSAGARVSKDSRDRGIDGPRVRVERVAVADPRTLRDLADRLKNELGSGIVVVTGVEDNKIALVAMVTPDLVDRYSAGKIVSEVAKIVGGKGGGRPDMAQGGGSLPDRLDEAEERIFELVRG